MTTFEKSFGTAGDVVEFLRECAADGTRSAFVLSAFEKPHIDTPNRRDELMRRVRFLHVAPRVTPGEWGDWNRELEVAQLLLPPDVYARFAQDHRDGITVATNSRDTTSTTYTSTVGGLTLQLLRWAESWQAFGGGSVGGQDVIWLVNIQAL